MFFVVSAGPSAGSFVASGSSEAEALASYVLDSWVATMSSEVPAGGLPADFVANLSAGVVSVVPASPAVSAAAEQYGTRWLFLDPRDGSWVAFGPAVGWLPLPDLA